MIQVHPIFQTPVFVVELEGLTDELGLAEYIAKMCRETPGTFGAGKVVQSRYNLNQDPKLGPLCEQVFQTVHSLMRDVYRYKPEYNIEITGMWGNEQKPGCVFDAHIHYNNVFSGVFFLNSCEGFPPITFWRPVESTLSPMTTQFNVFNQGSSSFEAKKDTLMLFPSWLRHSVPINQTNTPRLGVSFNVMLRGEFYNTMM